MAEFGILILISVCDYARSFNVATVVKRWRGVSKAGLSISMSGILDHRIDVSPDRDGSILKETLQTGNVNKDLPRTNDEVQLDWKIYHRNGTLAHSSQSVQQSLSKEKGEGGEPATTKFIFTDAETGEDIETVTTEQAGEEEPFTFRVGAEPREVILGWEYGVRTMREGETAAFEISSSMAFDGAGVPGIVDPNETIVCELTLLSILPNPLRGYKTVQEGESITDELMEKIQNRETPIAEETMDRSPATPNVIDPMKVDSIPLEGNAANAGGEFEKKRQWFDPSRHNIDSKARITGQGTGHGWEETASSIDILVPLPLGAQEVRKSDLDISIRHDRVRVALTSGEILLEGTFFGRVNTDECMWALSVDGIDSRFVQLSLEKAMGYREIWASALAFVSSPASDSR